MLWDVTYINIFSWFTSIISVKNYIWNVHQHINGCHLCWYSGHNTHGHSHTIVLFVCSATSEESNDKDDASNHNQQDGCCTDAGAEEVKECWQFALDDRTSDNQPQPSQLKIEMFSCEITTTIIIVKTSTWIICMFMYLICYVISIQTMPLQTKFESSIYKSEIRKCFIQPLV